jgi:hypothetical protein
MARTRGTGRDQYAINGRSGGFIRQALDAEEDGEGRRARLPFL